MADASESGWIEVGAPSLVLARSLAALRLGVGEPGQLIIERIERPKGGAGSWRDRVYVRARRPNADSEALSATEPLPAAFDQSEANEPARVDNASGWLETPRNAPCPCSSGRKFKMCHGGPQGSGEPALPARPSTTQSRAQPDALALELAGRITDGINTYGSLEGLLSACRRALVDAAAIAERHGDVAAALAADDLRDGLAVETARLRSGESMSLVYIVEVGRPPEPPTSSLSDSLPRIVDGLAGLAGVRLSLCSFEVALEVHLALADPAALDRLPAMSIRPLNVASSLPQGLRCTIDADELSLDADGYHLGPVAVFCFWRGGEDLVDASLLSDEALLISSDACDPLIVHYVLGGSDAEALQARLSHFISASPRQYQCVVAVDTDSETWDPVGHLLAVAHAWTEPVSPLQPSALWNMKDIARSGPYDRWIKRLESG